MKHLQSLSLAIFLGSMLALSLTSSIIPGPAAAQTAQNEFQLSVIPVIPRLPADGNEYFVSIQLQTAKDSKPVEAPHDIDILLSTSDTSVIAASSNILMKEGESLVNTAITTTGTAGNVQLTAQADGIKSGVGSIETIKLDSLEASKLMVYAGSDIFFPDPGFAGKMYVQLVNSGNIPVAAADPLTVYLSSTDPGIGTVPNFVQIPAGKSGTQFEFVPNYAEGSTKITASANSLAAGETTVKTAGPRASTLAVEFAPPTMPAPSGFYSTMTVQLRDDEGKPVKATNTVWVKLSSSDTGTAKVNSQISIMPGSWYASTTVKSAGKVGTATITATAPNLAPGSAAITAVEHIGASQDAEKKINTYVIPSIISPDNSEKAMIVLQVTDLSDNTYSFRHYMYSPILLSSSNPSIGAVQETANSETTYQIRWFKSSLNAGDTTILASASNYVSDQTQISAEGSVPASVKISQLPGTVVADSGSSSLVVLSLRDDKGNPVPTTRDLLIGLTSSKQDVAKVTPMELVPAGNNYGVAEMYPTNKAGTTTITATAAGLAPTSFAFKTIGSTGDSSPYKLGIFTIPELPADNRSYGAIVVQLLDSTGNPVAARSDVPVAISSSSSRTGSPQDTVVVAAGSTFASVNFTTTTIPGKFNVVASSQGFESVEATMETVTQPLTVVLSSTIPKKASFGELPVAADVFFGSIPLKDANIQVGGLYADPTDATTDENGHAESMYVPTRPGENTVSVTASKPGYEPATITSRISLEQTVSINFEALTEGGNAVQPALKVQGPATSKKDVALEVRLAGGNEQRQVGIVPGDCPGILLDARRQVPVCPVV
ncbi:hypothetical protein [Candidatus Nitrososphaera sp. FF02]|uniref:hypothetical protein n=1 Tax=Candidatus Nitrososphaera sp. FF02 TaxID=3398226 RepID=UPI0039EAB087